MMVQIQHVSAYRNTLLALVSSLVICCVLLHNQFQTLGITLRNQGDQYMACVEEILSKSSMDACRGVNISYIIASLNAVQSLNHPGCNREAVNPAKTVCSWDNGVNRASHTQETANSTLDKRVHTQCKIFRDLTSESNEDLTSRLFKYPHIISECGETPPILATYQSDVRHQPDESKEYPVPNIVHYIWFGEQLNVTFLSYLSLLSVHKFVRPDYIYIHGDTVKPPHGEWWERVRQTIPNVYLVKRTCPKVINGHNTFHIEHSADIARLIVQYLLHINFSEGACFSQDYGGIYFDWDVLVLRPFDTLRKYDMTLGRVTEHNLANGIILAKRGAPFLRIRLETYHSFNKKEWGEHSCHMPDKLLSVVPHLIHVEETSLIRPNWKETKLLFSGHYPWRNNYAIHVWKRKGKVPQNPDELLKADNTLGEVMRHVTNS